VSPHEYSSICAKFESIEGQIIINWIFYLSITVDRNDLVDGRVVGEEVGIVFALNFREWSRSRISLFAFAGNSTL